MWQGDGGGGAVAGKGEVGGLGGGGEEDPEAFMGTGWRTGRGRGDEAAMAKELELVGIEPGEEGIEEGGIKVDGRGDEVPARGQVCPGEGTISGCR